MPAEGDDPEQQPLNPDPERNDQARPRRSAGGDDGRP